MTNKQTPYIVFEGLNGCGKGTQINLFEDTLYDSHRGMLVSRIRTPNELCDSGSKARELLSREMDPYEKAQEAAKLFSKNHQITSRHIGDLQRMGHAVIADRNYLSTLAFQHAQGVDYLDLTIMLEGAKKPDLTFLLDVPVEVAMQRLGKRNDKEGRRKFDQDNTFMEQVRTSYLELAEGIARGYLEDKSIRVIDGTKRPLEIEKEIRETYEAEIGFL